MSGTNRLLPANVTLLQPGSRNFRLNDALNTPTTAITAQVTVLQGQVSTLQSQVTTLQAQVAAQQTVINSFSYLQTEVSTGTIFLDQRTIYKRSFVINNALDVALQNFVYPHGIVGINYVVNMQAFVAQAGGQQLPITFANMATAPNISIGVSGWADTTNIIISCASTTFVGYQVIATLWYTR